MSKERLEEIINNITFVAKSYNGIEPLIEYAKEQAEQVDSMAHVIKVKNKEMRELSNFLKERNIPLKELSPLFTVMNHVQGLERDFELCDSAMHMIDMTINNPETTDNDKWEKVNKLIKKYYADDCIHCNGKGFNGLDYCPNCIRGKIIQENMESEQQNERYLFTINAMRQVLKDARHSLDIGEKVQGLEYGIGMADAILESDSE